MFNPLNFFKNIGLSMFETIQQAKGSVKSAKTEADAKCLLIHKGRARLTDAILDRKSTRLNSSHIPLSRMPSSA